MEQIEPALVGGVRRLKPQVPLADDARCDSRPFELVGQRGNGRIEIAPRVVRVGADHARARRPGRDSGPVSSAARDGEHTVEFARIAVKSIPSAARRSMCGVRTSDAW